MNVMGESVDEKEGHENVERETSVHGRIRPVLGLFIVIGIFIGLFTGICL